MDDLVTAQSKAASLVLIFKALLKTASPETLFQITKLNAGLSHAEFGALVKAACIEAERERAISSAPTCDECGRAGDYFEGICLECQCALHAVGAFNMDGDGWR
jgi:hypothetical protein